MKRKFFSGRVDGAVRPGLSMLRHNKQSAVPCMGIVLRLSRLGGGGDEEADVREGLQQMLFWGQQRCAGGPLHVLPPLFAFFVFVSAISLFLTQSSSSSAHPPHSNDFVVFLAVFESIYVLLSRSAVSPGFCFLVPEEIHRLM
jgi:hypothetical protein